MRILSITFEPPGLKSGGALVMLQTLQSALGNGAVDYVCPENDCDLLEKCHTVHILQETHGAVSRIRCLLQHHATSCFCASWETIEPQLDWDAYDVVIIDKTQEPYFLKAAKAHGKKVLVRAHNVEWDYYANIHRLQPSLRNFVRKHLAYWNEKWIVEHADGIICLTEVDRARFHEAYHVPMEKLFLDPVCIDVSARKPSAALPADSDITKPYFLLTGSLWYGPNAEGARWLIENVWKQFSKTAEGSGYQLVCAGARPNEALKKLAKQVPDVVLADSPEDMQPYFAHAFAYVAPIFSGAGMKVKIAEALSYGLFVIGAHHALLGYEMREGIQEVATAEEFLQAMESLVRKERTWDAAQVMTEFSEKYTTEASVQNYKKFVQTISHAS